MSDPDAIGQPLPPAQQRALRASDPATGEVPTTGKDAAAVVAALVDARLVVRHGARRAPYLTELGRRVRAGLLQPGPPQTSPAGEGGFVPDTGNETCPPRRDGSAPDDAAVEARRAEVAAAWQSVLTIREVTGSGARPAAWELHPDRVQRAVSLALEHSGADPSAVDRSGRRTRTGYSATLGREPGTIQVRWAGPASSGARQEAEARLQECAGRLRDFGWDSLLYYGARRVPYLAVGPLR